MAQKYKVFLEDNWVLFTENDSDVLPGTSKYKPAELAIVTSVEMLHGLLQSKGNICVVSKNACKAMNSFFTNFKFIRTAGALVQRQGQDQFLWIKRFEHLDLPKGKIEKGERELEAAIREVQEETGLNGSFELKQKLANTYHVYSMKGKSYLKENHWFELIYVGAPQVVAQTEEGIEAVFWLSKKEWHARLSECYLGLKELLEMTC